MEKLSGGRPGILKTENIVTRPANIWTRDVHDFLEFLHKSGFTCVPKPVSVGEASEQVTYVEGVVYNDLLPSWYKSDETLIQIAKFIQTFHKHSKAYIHKLTGREQWMLKGQEPIEVICHGDLAPYNFTTKAQRIVGIIDFDTCHPGPYLWDLAYLAYRIVPLMDPSNPESFGGSEDKIKRLELLLDTYACDKPVEVVLDMVVKRLRALIDYMEAGGLEGDQQIMNNIELGHVMGYKQDITFIQGLLSQ